MPPPARNPSETTMTPHPDYAQGPARTDERYEPIRRRGRQKNGRGQQQPGVLNIQKPGDVQQEGGEKERAMAPPTRLQERREQAGIDKRIEQVAPAAEQP